MIPKSQVTITRREFSHHPVVTSRLRFSDRESYVVHLLLDGLTDEGEATPLVGFGEDSPERAHASLLELDVERLQKVLEVARRAAYPLLSVFDFSRELSSPSAQFAVETCLLSRISRERHMTISQLLREHIGLHTPGPERLSASRVVDPLNPEGSHLLRESVASGITTFKVKAGRDFDEEIAFCVKNSLLFPDVRFRLDPNKAWSLNELERLVERGLRVEWVEDPTSDPSDWRNEDCGVPIGLDEILVGEEPSEDFLRWAGASVVVLKPMALGGFSKSLAWAKAARALGLSVNVSHLFDGPRALDACAELAFAVQSPEFAPGLGPHSGLDGWGESSKTLRGAFLERNPGTP